MTRRLINQLEFNLSLAHLANPIVAFSLAAYVRFVTGFFVPQHPDSTFENIIWVLLVTLVWMLVVTLTGLNKIERLMALQTGIKVTTRALAYTMMVVLALVFFYRNAQLSRIFVITGCVLMFVFSLLVLYIFRVAAHNRRGPFKQALRIAIVGVDDYALHIAHHLESNRMVAVEVACFISPGEAQSADLGRPVLDADSLEQIADVFGCSEALVALPPERLGELTHVLEMLKNLCVPVRVVLDIENGVFVPERIFSFCGLPLLDVRPYPVDSVGYFIGKRIFDIVLSMTALLLAAPVLAMVALAIKLSSHGPVLFSQERLSLNGKRFKMLKFRTMRVQERELSDTLHTAKNDPRITALGSFLRKTSLDEFPQFVNVLRGEMSVVGPRPELTHYVRKFRREIPTYMSRHNVKCGITGMAQINGFRGSDTSIPHRIEQDLYYLQNWSLLLDMKIIFQTVARGFVSKGVY